MTRRKANRRRFHAGQAARVVANVGIRNDDDSSVPSHDLKGQRVTVAGVNSTYVSSETGEEMVGCTLDNGALTAVPSRALRHEEATARAGWSRAFAEGWRRIFGH